MYYYHMGYGFFGFGMVIFWGLVIWLVVWLVRSTQNQGNRHENSLDILKKRYANGEITTKQYHEMKKELF